MELIVRNDNSVAQAIGGLFENVDFSGMSAIVENIGDVSKDLTDGEKQLASQLVADWEVDIISTLEMKAEEMQQFVQFLDLSERLYYSTHNDNEMHDIYGEVLANKTGTLALYQQFLAKRQEAKEFEQEKKPHQTILGSDASFAEKTKAETDYAYEISVFEVDLTRLIRQSLKLEREWKKEILKNTEVQELLLGAKKFKKGLTKLEKECKTKSRLAKLNIAVNSKEARAALAELLNFKIAI